MDASLNLASLEALHLLTLYPDPLLLEIALACAQWFCRYCD